jgi:hypothetical protein
MEDNNFYVYGLIDPRTDKPFYVGKGTIIDKYGRKYRRISDHLNLLDESNIFKNRIIRKINKLNLEVKTVIYEQFKVEDDALKVEIELIKLYGRRNNKTGILTNLTDGGEGSSGFKHSEDTKKKQSEIRKKYYETHEANFKGCKHSEKSKTQSSNSLKKYYKNNPHPSLGIKRSEEVCKRQSERQLGKKPPKEICYKFASHGEKNYFAKSYTFISPKGDSYFVKGEFKKFISNNGLSLMACKKSVNMGKIPPPKNPNHNKMTSERLDTTGWEIILEHTPQIQLET